jgi:hypothetical protein
MKRLFFAARVIFYIACGLAALLGATVVAGLLWLSSAQHSTSTNLHLAQGGCPSGTTLESATIGSDGKVDAVGDGKVAFDLAPDSKFRSAGVDLTAKDGFVVKAASVSGDKAGAQQLQAEEGTDVTTVRVGQFNRGTSVARADACVGTAGLLGKLAGFAHTLGKTIAISMAVFLVLIAGVGYMIGKYFGRKAGRRESVTTASTNPANDEAPTASVTTE